MPYSDKLMNKKQKVKLDAPILTLKGIRATSEIEFERIYTEVSSKNRDWMHQNAPDPKVSWMYVSPKGQIWGYGYGNMFPSTKQVMEVSELVGKPLFLMQRLNQQYCDASFFLAQTNQKKIEEIFNRLPEDFEDYKGLNEGILTIDAQSGLVNNLRNALFALGKLKRLKPKSALGRERLHSGATVADVTNIGWASSDGYKYLHLASENADEVHSRGSRVTGERIQDAGSGVKRIERLHRFDDSILDIFDTYSIKSKQWHPLVLYGAREEFGVIKQDLNGGVRHFDWMPLYEPYKR